MENNRRKRNTLETGRITDQMENLTALGTNQRESMHAEIAMLWYKQDRRVHKSEL